MGGPVYNNPFQTRMYPVYPYATPGAPTSWFTPVPPPQDAFNHSSNGQPEQKSHGILGAIKDFGKGIFNGVVNMVKGIFTLKGLALTIGSLAFMWAAPALAIPLLTLGALAVGGVQVVKGITTGNWEKAGEGVSVLGATLLGAKFGTKFEPAIKDADGAEYVLTKTVGGNKVKATGLFDRLLASAKSLIPIKSGNLHKIDGGVIDPAVSKNAYQLSRDSIVSKFQALRDRFRG